MGNVNFQITGDDKDIVAAYQKLQREMIKTEEANKRLAAQARKGATEVKSANEEGIGTLLKLNLGTQAASLAMEGLNRAVGAVRQGYSLWREEMDKLAESSRKTNEEILKGIQGAGAGRAQEIQAFARRPIGLSSTAERVGAFEGVREAAPMMAASDQMALAAAVSRAAPLGDTRKIGALASEVAEFAPGTSPNEAVNLTLAMQRRAGDQAGRLADPGFQRTASLLKEAGYSNEEAIALGLTAMDANVGQKTLEQFALQGKDGMNDALKKRIGLVDFDKAQRLAGELRQDMQGDLVGREIAALQGTSIGAEAIAQRQVATRTELESLDEESAARNMQRTRDSLTAMEREMGLGPLHPARLIGRAVFEGLAFTSSVAGSDQPGTAAMTAMNQMAGGGQQNSIIDREMEIQRQQLQEMQMLRRDIGTAVRSNAVNDLNTHTEGR